MKEDSEERGVVEEGEKKGRKRRGRAEGMGGEKDEEERMDERGG